MTPRKSRSSQSARKQPDTAKIIIGVVSGAGGTGLAATILARQGSPGLAAVVGIVGLTPTVIYVVAAHAAALGGLVKAIGDFLTVLTSRRLHLRRSRDFSNVVKAAMKNPSDRDLRTLLHDIESMHPDSKEKRLRVRTTIDNGHEQPNNDEPETPPEDPPRLHKV